MNEKLLEQVKELEKEYKNRYLPYSARYDLATNEVFLDYLTYMIDEQNTKNEELKIPKDENCNSKLISYYIIVGVNGLRDIIHNHAELNYIDQVKCRFYFSYRNRYYTILNSQLEGGTTIFTRWNGENHNDEISTFNIIRIEDILSNKDNPFKNTNRMNRMINEIKSVMKRYSSNSEEIIDLLQFMNTCNIIK